MEVASLRRRRSPARGDGGCIWPDFLPAYDAAVTLVKLLDLLAPRSTGRCPRSCASLPSVHVAHETIVTPWERKGTVMREIVEQVGTAHGRARRRREDPRPDGWALVLPDPEDALTHVWAEAGSDQAARRLAQEYVAAHPPDPALTALSLLSAPMQFPDELRYSTEHEWVRRRRRPRRVGITDFAQDALGDVVYVELPDVGLAVIATVDVRRGRVDEVGVGDLLAAHRHRRRGEPGARRRARADQPGPVRRGLDLRRSRWPTRRRSTRCSTRPRTASSSRRSSHRRRWRLVDELDSSLDAAEEQMDADTALLDEVAGGAPPGAAPLPLGARPRCRSVASSPTTTSTATPAARLGVEVVRRPTGGQGAAARRRPHLRGRASRGPRAPTGRCDAVYCRLAGALDRRARPPRRRGAIARHDRAARRRRPRRAGVLREHAGRRPAGGGPQAVWLGAGAARRRGAPARLDPPRPPRRSTRPTCSLAPRRGRRAARPDDLRRATVTLAELGAPRDPRVVADGAGRGLPRRPSTSSSRRGAPTLDLGVARGDRTADSAPGRG